MPMTDEVPQLRRDGEASAVGLRASHADRDRAVDLLQVAAGDGRLTPGELDERLEAALTARPRGELAALTTDLTAASGSAAGSRRLGRRISSGSNAAAAAPNVMATGWYHTGWRCGSPKAP